jgi:hypothetical protein
MIARRPASTACGAKRGQRSASRPARSALFAELTRKQAGLPRRRPGTHVGTFALNGGLAALGVGVFVVVGPRGGRCTTIFTG